MVTEASGGTPLSEIRHKPLRHTVRTRIEEAIVQGTFKGGEKSSTRHTSAGHSASAVGR